VPVGTYEVVASKPGYLEARKANVIVTANAVLLLPDAQLRGGDANNDCMINIFDLVVVAWNYGSAPPTDVRADINGNGSVEIFDLVLVAVNLDQSCPGAWTVPVAATGAQSTAALELTPAKNQVEVGDLVIVTVNVKDASELYGADIGVTFDPSVVEVVDADPVRYGVQVAAGTFLDTTEPNGILAMSVANNSTGTIRYAASLMSPSPAAQGSGPLCTITFRAKAAGYTGLRIASALLINQRVQPVEVAPASGWIHVGSNWINGIPVVWK
jgi:hypothetical protein